MTTGTLWPLRLFLDFFTFPSALTSRPRVMPSNYPPPDPLLALSDHSGLLSDDGDLPAPSSSLRLAPSSPSHKRVEGRAGNGEGRVQEH